MDKYELKKRIVSALSHSDVKKYGKINALLLSRYAINNYRPIPAANGKLKYLHDLVFGERHDEHGHAGGKHCPDDEPGHADRGGYAAVVFHDVPQFI